MSPNRVPQQLDPEQVRQGATVKAIREIRGFKVGELAATMGISYAYLSNIEAGRKRLTPQMVAKAAEALRIPQAAIVSPGYFDGQVPA